MKELITTNLTVTDNIKDYFYLYYWKREDSWLERKKELVTDKWGMPEYKIVKGYKEEKFEEISFDKMPKMTVWNKTYKLGLTGKYVFLMQKQIGLLEKIGITGDEVIDFIVKKIEDGVIPERYMPKTMEIQNVGNKRLIRLYQMQSAKKKGWKINFRLFQISFYEPIISLIEQKFFNDIFNYKQAEKIVTLFKSLSEHNGMEFDEYIDKWAKRLLKENKL